MNPHAHATTVAATTLLGVLVAAAGCLLLARRPRWGTFTLYAGAAVGTAFQVGHLTEHVAQFAYWLRHPRQPPWMTPWAETLAASFQAFAPTVPGFGMEALHLTGNAIFLVGAIAVMVAIGRSAHADARDRARRGVWVQGIHVAEHVALTATVVLAGRPMGVSTLFGLLDPGPALWSYRVLWHLAINVIASALVASALAGSRRGVTRVPGHRVATTG